MKNIFFLTIGLLAFNIAFSQKSHSTAKDPEKAIAVCNYYLENYGAAIKGLSKAFANDTSDAEMAYLLGSSYANLEQYGEAISFYNRAVKLDASNNLWDYELGLLYYNFNNYRNAAIFFNKAAGQGYPQKNDLLENLGYAYMYSGELKKGEKLLLDIFTKKPGNKGILRDIAEAYYDQKMYDKSLAFCQKLIKLNVNDARALYQAGLCFQKKGQKSKGQEFCDKAIDIDPSLVIMTQKKIPAGLSN